MASSLCAPAYLPTPSNAVNPVAETVQVEASVV